MYSLEYTQTAEECFRKLRRHEPKAFKKLGKLLLELMEHPETGTGHPEQLKGDRVGQWSRRITSKHRLIYQIKKLRSWYWSFPLTAIMRINRKGLTVRG